MRDKLEHRLGDRQAGKLMETIPSINFQGSFPSSPPALPPRRCFPAFVKFSKWPTWLEIIIIIKKDGWGLTTNIVAVSSRISAIKHEAREALTFPLFEMNGDINIYCFVALTSDALPSPSPFFFFFHFPLTLEERGQFVPSIDLDLTW